MAIYSKSDPIWVKEDIAEFSLVDPFWKSVGVERYVNYADLKYIREASWPDLGQPNKTKEENQMFYQESKLLDAVREIENAAIHLRQFAAKNLRPEYGLQNPTDEIQVAAQVELTQEGWLKFTLPVMLPKRGEKDPARFLDGPLLSAIRSYFTDKPLPKFRTCVLVYEHIYNAAFPRRRVTDHDNLELKHVQDVLESAFLTNDTATLCSAFQCSHRGDMDNTCIWILTPEQFPEWLTKHENCWKTAPKI